MDAALKTCCLIMGLMTVATGCAGGPQQASQQTGNPLFVRAQNEEDAWETTVDVVHDYLFEIERESRIDGVIETKFKTGAGVLEPWHRDSADGYSRWESTLQSIRRKAYISVTPAQGGYFVSVEAFKEIEDVAGAANFAGGATFQDHTPLQRDLDLVVGQSSPSGWIPRGRDAALERSMLQSIQNAFNR